MVDLGRPDQYGGAEGVVELIKIDTLFRAGPVGAAQLEFFTTEAGSLWRPRVLWIRSGGSGTVGSYTLTFQALPSGGSSGPYWPTTGGLVAAADRDVAAGEDYHYMWSTEVGNSYQNLESDFGRTWVGGMPLIYLPDETICSIHFTGKGGYDGDYEVVGGHMQIERFRPDTVLGGRAADLAEIYLLPVNQ